MKKTISIFTLCISLLIGSLIPYHEVQASEVLAERIITPMFTNINAFNNTFNILENGEAHCGSYLSFRNADSARIIIYLEKYINGNWVVIKSWTSTAVQTDIFAYCYGSYSVPSGAQYRMRSFGYVFIGGSIVESISHTFDPQYY